MLQAIRVLVADDQEILRVGVRKFIEDQPDMRVTAEAATGEEVLRLVRSEIFDIVLLDSSMPRKNGVDCLRAIRQFNETLPILVVSNFPEKQYALSMLRLGANGYFQKSDRPEELIKAVRKVVGGHTYLSRNAAEIFASALARPDSKEPHDMLSAREYQVFHKLAAGVKAYQIARELNLSTKTVSTYRARVLGKIGVNGNAELIRYAMKNSLLD